MRPRARPVTALLRWLLWLACALLPLAAPAAEPHFPPLTGHVVDQANLLDARQREAIDALLVRHEAGSGEQIVVVTLAGLEGWPIEEYGYRLGRAWGIGQKGKDNGALLIVAPRERRSRIEVGYGLEDRLTDAATAVLTARILLPAFRQGDYAGGIEAGLRGMLDMLGSEPLAARPERQADAGIPWMALLPVLLLFFFLRRMGGGNAFIGPMILGGMFGRSGGSYDGGGFSGGGGSFGGGGSSGRW